MTYIKIYGHISIRISLKKGHKFFIKHIFLYTNYLSNPAFLKITTIKIFDITF